MLEKNLRFKEGDFVCRIEDVIKGEFVPQRIAKSFPGLAVDYYVENGKEQTQADDEDLMTLEQARYIIIYAMVKYVKYQMAEMDEKIKELRSNPGDSA